ncbi:MAG: CHRD domain-containing protein [Nitrososphaeraceae archaeon]
MNDGDGLHIPPSQGGPIDTPGAGFSVLKFIESDEEGGFVLILVLFILLVIIGAGFGTAHLHLGEPDEVGPQVLTLCGDKVSCTDGSGLARRTFTTADLEGPLAGQPMSALFREILKGNTYSDVHTPEHPDGEIRGEILVP